MAAKKLSGHARRKRDREAARLANPQAIAPGAYVPRPVVGHIDTVSDIARELRRVFREVRMGTLEADLGSKQGFIGTQALKATQVEMELANQAAIIAELQAQRSGRLGLMGEAALADVFAALPATETEDVS
jgi:hypothetical protein